MEARFERMNLSEVDWDELDSYQDRNIHQTKQWILFISESVNATPIVARLKEGSQTLGYFTGLLMKKYGVKILGSPFPGWSTTYMGFNLRDGVSRVLALKALERFAFEQLQCLHLEIMDRMLSEEEIAEAGYSYFMFKGYEIDLTPDEDTLFKNMKRQCRGCVRKAAKSGVVIEQANDMEFAEEFYHQLRDIFLRQDLLPPYGVDRVRSLIRNLLPTGNLLLLRAVAQSGKHIATGIFPAMNGVVYAWGLANWRSESGVRPVEAIVWHAMKYWKQRGMRVWDFVGGGSYKLKYGAYPIAVPWARRSCNPWISACREVARPLFDTRQRVLGTVRNIGKRLYGNSDK